MAHRQQGGPALGRPVGAEQLGGHGKRQRLFSPGNRLTVNAYAADGSIGAELISVDGHVIPGYSAEDCDTFTGDSLSHTFTWNGNPDVGRCLPARIRFYLERARLYALQLPRA